MTLDDVGIARVWAELNAGDDPVIDVFEYKIYELLRDEAAMKAVWWERRVTKAENLMAPIEDAFIVSGETDDAA